MDLGCGVGLLGLYLHLRGDRRELRGIDFDSRKLEDGRRAANALQANVRLERGDVRDAVNGFSGHVVILDVLHYLADEEQKRVLLSAARSTGEGELLLIRDCLRDGSWRYRVTWIQEWLAHAVGWLRGERLNFPTAEFITNTLAAAGLELVEIRPLWFRTPFNNYLLTFRRKK